MLVYWIRTKSSIIHRRFCINLLLVLRLRGQRPFSPSPFSSLSLRLLLPISLPLALLLPLLFLSEEKDTGIQKWRRVALFSESVSRSLYSLSMSVYVSLSRYMSHCLFICLPVYGFLYLSLSMSLCMLSLCMSLCLCVCISVSVYVSLSLCLYLSLSLYMSLSLYISLCLCVCLFVFVSVSKSMRLCHFPL